jgi:hypothetical protein
MTTEELYGLVQTMSGETDDAILDAYIQQAGDIVLQRAYPYDDTHTEVPMKYQRVQADIAVYLINKRGAEGETVHLENGISRHYEAADVPPSLLRRITPLAGVVFPAVTE